MNILSAATRAVQSPWLLISRQAPFSLTPAITSPPIMPILLLLSQVGALLFAVQEHWGTNVSGESERQQIIKIIIIIIIIIIVRTWVYREILEFKSWAASPFGLLCDFEQAIELLCAISSSSMKLRRYYISHKIIIHCRPC